MVMPFGKHKGVEIDDIDIKYLQWLYENAELFGKLEEVICEKLGVKPKEKKEKKQWKDDRNVDPCIKTIYREMAFKYHPDHGGNTAAMQAINDFYNKIIESY